MKRTDIGADNIKRRNIVVILCDQLRKEFLGAYGCQAVPTPNIDFLAGRGVVFDKAITQSTVCAPARACMMTGKYVSDHGVWTNDVPFREGLEYLPERMNALGYRTGAFGKLHHYPAKDVKGFQYARQMEEGRLGEAEDYLVWLRERHPEVTRIWNYHDGMFDFREEEYYEHWIASCAMDYIRDHASDHPDRPFLAWISFQGPHGPFDPPAEVKGSVDVSRLPVPLMAEDKTLAPVVRYRRILDGALRMTSEQVMFMRRDYAEMVVEIDRQIGRVLDCLRETGQLEETSIIFSSDHGDLLGDYGLNAKGPYPYQGQLAIPMIVSNHPDLAEGTRSDALAGNIDIPATVLDMAGADRGIGMSRSLLPLGGRCPETGREVIFSEFCDSIKTVDDGCWRFSYYPFTGARELYDRIADPEERYDLAGTPAVAEVEARMLGHIVDFMILAKGVRVNAYDLIPEQQEGIAGKHPDFLEEIPVAFPINRESQLALLKEAGLDWRYNEFCREREILAHYGVYWRKDRA